VDSFSSSFLDLVSINRTPLVGSAARGPFKVQLFAASMIPIVRHIKVQSGANPFDPAWDDYFARPAAKTNFVFEPGLSGTA
jgi:hypothetical protein